jgi:hypothetical protein
MNDITSQAKSTTHQLVGLEADNLLAFLALLGLLRALDEVRPEWQARVAWQGAAPAAELHLAAAVSREDIVGEVNAGIRQLGTAYGFDRKDLKYTADEFRALAQQAQREPERGRLVAALASDGAVRRKSRERRVEVTPLCLLLGQGHQHFLSRLTEMTQRNEEDDEAHLQRALFETWRYEDRDESFRWDPIEDRRYAHQYGDPSEGRNKIGTVAGANRLAAIGFSLLVSAPTAAGLATLGVTGSQRERFACWPVVGLPTSLSGYVALLAHPALSDEEAAPGLARCGVLAVARARRYQVDRYFNFERSRLQFL